MYNSTLLKFSTGDKVVPINKSAGMIRGLVNSNCWCKAQYCKQPYLYVIRYSHCEKGYLCSSSATKCNGEFFSESDLLPYIENNNELFAAYVKGSISKDEYKSRITKEV